MPSVRNLQGYKQYFFRRPENPPIPIRLTTQILLRPTDTLMSAVSVRMEKAAAFG